MQVKCIPHELSVTCVSFGYNPWTSWTKICDWLHWNQNLTTETVSCLVFTANWLALQVCTFKLLQVKCSSGGSHPVYVICLDANKAAGYTYRSFCSLGVLYALQVAELIRHSWACRCSSKLPGRVSTLCICNLDSLAIGQLLFQTNFLCGIFPSLVPVRPFVNTQNSRLLSNQVSFGDSPPEAPISAGQFRCSAASWV